VRQVADVVQGVAQVRRHVGDQLVRDGPAGVADRLEELGRLLLELGIEVVPGAHLGAQLDVRAPGLLGGRGPFAVQAVDLVVQRQDRLQRLVAHRLRHAERLEAERLEDRAALRPLHRDLECGALRRGIGLQQFVGRGAERERDGAQHRQPGSRLPFSIADTCEGARSIAAASSPRVMPTAVRRSRMRRPSVSASTSSPSPGARWKRLREPYGPCDRR
jgi:hypothetical protein